MFLGVEFYEQEVRIHFAACSQGLHYLKNDSLAGEMYSKRKPLKMQTALYQTG